MKGRKAPNEGEKLMVKTHLLGANRTHSFRVAAALVLAMLVAIAIAFMVLPAGPASAKAKKFKTVTRTFSSDATGPPIKIPDSASLTGMGPANPYPSVINVSGLKKGKIQDVNVVFHNFKHAVPDDVDALLAGPRGQNAIIMSDVGDSNPVSSPIDLVLDDQATNPLPTGQLNSGTFKPTNLQGDDASTTDSFPAPAPTPSGNSKLQVFHGTNPNGAWQLFINDDKANDVGQLGRWSLVITAKVKK